MHILFHCKEVPMKLAKCQFLVSGAHKIHNALSLKGTYTTIGNVFETALVVHQCVLCSTSQESVCGDSKSQQ